MVLKAKQQNHPRLDGFENLLEQVKKENEGYSGKKLTELE